MAEIVLLGLLILASHHGVHLVVLQHVVGTVQLGRQAARP